MFASRLFILTTLVACTVVPATHCWAQAYGLEGIVADNDLRWFEPAELDLDGRMEKEAGYFLRIDKVGFYFSGERVEIGDPDVVSLSEQIYPDTSIELAQANVNGLYSDNPILDPAAAAVVAQVTFEDDGMGGIVTDPLEIVDPDDDDLTIIIQVPRVATTEGGLPPQYVVRNGILDATPTAQLGWGERYEFGYSDGERGWMVGILDGPEANTGGIFGSLPIDDLDGDVDTTSDFGFGQVVVNFDLPTGYLTGFRNYLIFDDGDDDGDQGVNGGPISVPIVVGEVDEDLAIDDINGNGSTFRNVFADLDGDGELDEDEEVIGRIVDTGDFHTFLIVFDQVDVRNRVEMDGVEFMFTHELDRSHKLDRGRRDNLQLRYGVNYLRLNDEFNADFSGSVIGETFIDHTIDNQIVGPQVGLRWTRDHGKWDFTFDGRATLGYNIVDQDQSGLFGGNQLPGAVNNPLIGRANFVADSLHVDDFSPMAEIRAEARYKVTKALAVKIGYNARFIDNVYRASQAVDYTENLGFKDGYGKSDIFINGFTMGVEFRH